ncbi:MAG: hypothetical protein HY818_01065 [Acetobacterium woodii]|nr:hypothetical protein [Acetobacterium woodii]
MNDKKEMHVLEAHQNFEAFQRVGKYYWSPYHKRLGEFERVLNYLMKTLDCKQSDLLFEILITRDEIVFCDAKNPHMEEIWNGIKDFFNDVLHCGNMKLRNEIKESSLEKIDGFDIDLEKNKRFAKHIGIVNGALLAHYITRNFSKFDVIEFIL